MKLCKCDQPVFVDDLCKLCWSIARYGEVEGKIYYEKRFEPDVKDMIISDDRKTKRVE